MQGFCGEFESHRVHILYLGLSFSGLGHLAYIQEIAGSTPASPTLVYGVMVAHRQGTEVLKYICAEASKGMFKHAWWFESI